MHRLRASFTRIINLFRRPRLEADLKEQLASIGR